MKSKIATNFRRWATERLKEYMIKGFTMDDDRLKNLGGGNYWKELLDRIRDIRSSEKVMYRQVLDLYATSVDYDPKSSESIAFFKMVQNKLHYAAHGHTVAEVIYERADASQPFMGLKSFSGDFPVLKDISIAKNYLNDEELKILNNIVSGYFDFAEIQAMRHNPMYMADYVEHLDNVLKTTGEKVLQGAGTISYAQAIEKATEEYKKYQIRYTKICEQKKKMKDTRTPEKLNKELDRLNLLFQKDRITWEYYSTEYDRIEKELKELSAIQPEAEKDFIYLEELLRSDFKKIYEQLTPENRRTFWRSTIEEIHLNEDYTVESVDFL